VSGKSSWQTEIWSHLVHQNEKNEASEGMASQFNSCLCLRFRKGARQTTKIYDEFLAPSGLRITQFGLLAHLEENGGPLAVAELAGELNMDPTTLNRNLKPLERRKLLRIRASVKDRRAKEIWLTATGRKVLREAAPLWKAAHDQVFAALGQSEAQMLSQMLDRSLQRLDPVAADQKKGNKT
jgi:DNA-binding MarR family transcriptional regulator